MRGRTLPVRLASVFQHLFRVFPLARRTVLQGVVLAHRTTRSAIDHEVPTIAQATAYSAMVALFPALILAAAFIALLPHYIPVRAQMMVFFGRVLPSNVQPVLYAYFDPKGRSPQTARALLSAVVVTSTGAGSVIATLMEGFRRAHNIPIELVGFWRKRLRALVLVPLSLVPMSMASGLVIFGDLLTHWLANHVAPGARVPVSILAFLLRWGLALSGSVGILAVIYHLGTDVTRHMREHMEGLWQLRIDWSWRASLPGATVATGMWFITTLLFGYYVTRFANYSRVYGSLGAAIALMFWLYIIALSVLCGAEFNAQLAHRRRLGDAPAHAAEAFGAEAAARIAAKKGFATAEPAAGPARVE